MKPIHHALVSARLFGGVPEDYLAVHNAFDMSKAALGDMRHRAALHSVDHGGAVMKTIFPERIGNASLQDVCTQHVHDDQGFSVTLDTWLEGCTIPAFLLAAHCPSPALQGFLTAPEEACSATWGGKPEDYADICAYYRLPEQFSDHPLAPAISRNAFSIFFSEMAFGAAITVTGKSGRKKYVPVRNIGESLALAAFGHLPSLPEVVQTMTKKDWMFGARVPRSQRRRAAAAGRPDLFSEDGLGEQALSAAHVGEAAVRAVLTD